ncbi:phosphate signaling complex protein PhoU [Paenibacillus campi]|uniref:phosphate signaling complex protein PhoU n=1 Tax=Paenibacillus campi TaxID=3106031 RepID=UPI002AFF9720|nr:phosphate signaling complex protein PhoU [Paenibacillus sp. SGZ-1014]
MPKRKEFDENLDVLRELLISMGDHVIEALQDAVKSMQMQNVPLAKSVVDNDYRLNEMEEKIMDIGSRLIITQQPVAKDLRRIIVAFKVSSDLERMGDLACDVAKVTLRLQGAELIKPLKDIPHMADIVIQMIQESIQSYLDENTDLAHKVGMDDDQVDHLYSSMIRELHEYIKEDGADGPQIMLVNMTGRYIERIGDHATNIAESVVYLVTGKRPDLNR